MKIFTVDAFTERPFLGNPAAVCLMPPGGRPDDWMQAVAAEMNLSETAFPLREGGDWRLRWFTPAVEVALCGHATLATAHILWQEGLASPDVPIRFRTRSGPLEAMRDGSRIRLDLPADLPAAAPLPGGMTSALGLAASDVTWSGRGRENWIIELPGEERVLAARPDFAKLRTLLETENFGVIVTAAGAPGGVDFVSRYFAPAHGIDEDPVTGSAHCLLGPYWSSRLSRNPLEARQVSRRGGAMTVRVAGDRVALTGSAVTVLRGEID